MKNIFTLFFILIISFNAISQNKVIDSLTQELNKEIPEIEKANILIELSKKTWAIDPKESRSYSNQAVKIAISNGFENEEAQAYTSIAVSYIYSNNYNKPIEYLNKSIAIAKRTDNKILEANNYLSFGIIYYYTYDYYNSLLFYDKALKLYREEKEVSRVATSLINISIIYFQTKDYEKALEYALECNTVLKGSNTVTIAGSFQQTAECYTKLKQTELAKEYAQKTIDIYEREDDSYRLNLAYITLADAYFEGEEYTKAYAIFNSIYAKVIASKNESLKMTYYDELSKVLYGLKRYEEALLNAHKAFKIAKERNDNLIIYDTSKIIAEASGKLKKCNDVESFYALHIKYQDSLVGNNFSKGRLEHELSEAAIKVEKEKEIEASKQKNLLLFIVTCFLFVFLLFGVYFYRKLNKLYKKSNESNKSKSIFLSKVTHEIKTPLTSIIGFSDLLKNSNLNKEQSEFNNNIAISYNRLLKLSNEILETSQLKEEKVKLFEKEQNLNVFLNAIKKEYTIEANQKGLIFNVDYKLFNNQLFYDNAKLLKVIDNLLVNAIRFTDSGAVSFIINLETESEKEADISFTIKDTGIGISENHIGKIQKEFYQIISNEKDNVGIGLGLSIVKQSLSLMGSKLNIDSKLHQGSLFSFKLKLKKGELIKQEATRDKIDKVSFSKPLKILIAEDNKLTSLLIKKMLELLFNNIQISQAYDGVEAVSNYTEQEPDIILMDLQMPNLNGFEATKSIRKLQKGHIPIIACSASLLADNIEKCKTFGLDDYIEKPINKELLKAILLKYITPVN